MLDLASSLQAPFIAVKFHKSEVKSLSCVRLFAIPWTVVYQASLSMGFSRQEYWSEVPLPSPYEQRKPNKEEGTALEVTGATD